jgi:hypothetical protein
VELALGPMGLGTDLVRVSLDLVNLSGRLPDEPSWTESLMGVSHSSSG